MTKRIKINRQSDLNVGTAGHVDHGKCIARGSPILLQNRGIVYVEDLWSEAREKGVVVRASDNEWVYLLDDLSVISIDTSSGELLPTKSLLYVQKYRGKIYNIVTSTGRSIRLTPDHPVLTYKDGFLRWVRARDLHVGMYIVVPNKIPDVVERGRWSVRKDIHVLEKEGYIIVDTSTLMSIQTKSNGFTDCRKLTGRELNVVRILAGLSRSRFARLVHMDYRRLSRILRDDRTIGDMSLSLVQKFNGILGKLTYYSLNEDELLIVKDKHGRKPVIVKDLKYLNEEIVKWLALYYAEGYSEQSGKISVAQLKYEDMIREFISITKKYFGVEVKKYGRLDFHIYSKPLIDYLRVKFDFIPGSKRESNIPGWFVSMPLEYQSIFLRWIFTLDGHFDRYSGQIELTQANRNNINIISYMLLNFGIFSRIYKKHVGREKYHRLSISGRDNLRLFISKIGFEDQEVVRHVEEYVEKVVASSKKNNLLVPIEPKVLRRLLKLSGFNLNSMQSKPDGILLKRRAWYKAYEESFKRGRINRRKLREIIKDVEERVYHAMVEAMKNNISKAILLLGVSLSDLSTKLGVSSKTVRRVIYEGVQKTGVFSEINDLIDQRVEAVNIILAKLRVLASENIVFDRISTIYDEDYNDYIFDLVVPGFHNFIGGFGGLILHNTSIIESLTGIWTSSHSEELRRGITIRIGYADMPIFRLRGEAGEIYWSRPEYEGYGDAELVRVISFVDCPGHESLMANMLSGAAVMDSAMLVIAANEPVPRPQTKEHTMALQIMGVKDVVVVQNKIDLVSKREAKENYEMIKDFLSTTIYADAPIIPISAVHRVNLHYLVEALYKYIPIPNRDLSKPYRMFIIRSFDINKPGTPYRDLKGGVIGGSILQGRVRIGDEMEILPGYLYSKGDKIIHEPLYTTVQSLRTRYVSLKEAYGGGLIGVQTDLDPYLTKSDNLVGNVAGKPDTLPPVVYDLELDVDLFKYVVGTDESIEVKPISMNERLRLNIGPAVTLGIVTSARPDSIHVSLHRPVVAESGWRVAIATRVNNMWRLIGVGKVR